MSSEKSDEIGSSQLERGRVKRDDGAFENIVGRAKDLEVIALCVNEDKSIELVPVELWNHGIMSEYSLEPKIICSCSSGGRGSSGPWDHNGTDCFILYYIDHTDKCKLDFNGYSGVLDHYCSCGHSDIDNKHKGKLYFVKSRSGSDKVEMDFKKPPVLSELIRNCSYVDCEQSDIERLKRVMDRHIESLHRHEVSLCKKIFTFFKCLIH